MWVGTSYKRKQSNGAEKNNKLSLLVDSWILGDDLILGAAGGTLGRVGAAGPPRGGNARGRGGRRA